MFKICFKDLRIFLSDKKGLALTFALPIVLITIFALAFGGIGNGKDKATELYVELIDSSAQSKLLVKKLDSLKEFDVNKLEIGTGDKAIKKGSISAYLRISNPDQKTKDQPALELRYDGAKEAEVGMIQGALMSHLYQIMGSSSIQESAIKSFEKSNSELDPALQAQIKEQIKQNINSEDLGETASSILKTTCLIADPQTSVGLVQAVAGTAIMMLLFSVAGLGASLIEEKQEGTFNKILVSPLKAKDVLWGKLLMAVIIAVFQLCIMFFYAGTVLGLDLSQNVLSLVVLILVTAFACASFGLLLSVIAKTRQQVQSLSTLVILIMSCIGGSMMPLFIMPTWMQKMAVVSVNYWGIQGFYDIFWRKLEFLDPTFLTRLAVLLSITVVFNVLALRFFRKNFR